MVSTNFCHQLSHWYFFLAISSSSSFMYRIVVHSVVIGFRILHFRLLTDVSFNLMYYHMALIFHSDTFFFCWTGTNSLYVVWAIFSAQDFRNPILFYLSFFLFFFFLSNSVEFYLVQFVLFYFILFHISSFTLGSLSIYC